METKKDGSSVSHEKFRLSKLIGDGETRGIDEAWDLRQLDEPELLQLAAEAGLVHVSQLGILV